MTIDIKTAQERLKNLYKDYDHSKDDDKEILRRERHSLLVKGLPRPDNAIRINQPEIKAKIASTMSQRHQDPNGPYFEHHIGRPSMNRTNITTEHLNSNPEIVKKKIENSRAYNTSEEGRKKYLEGRKKIQVQYQDPNGKIWPSRKEAAAAWNIIPQTLSKLANKPNSGWKKL